VGSRSCEVETQKAPKIRCRENKRRMEYLGPALLWRRRTREKKSEEKEDSKGQQGSGRYLFHSFQITQGNEPPRLRISGHGAAPPSRRQQAWRMARSWTPERWAPRGCRTHSDSTSMIVGAKPRARREGGMFLWVSWWCQFSRLMTEVRPNRFQEHRRARTHERTHTHAHKPSLFLFLSHRKGSIKWEDKLGQRYLFRDSKTAIQIIW